MNRLEPVTDISKIKAEALVRGAGSLREAVERIAGFVRNDILYLLDEWNASPEDILKKGYGMCAGKALLAGELFRAVGIKVQFKVLQISGEQGLFDFIAQHLSDIISSGSYNEELRTVLSSIRSLPLYRDHIIVQVFLDGEWLDLDLARDGDLDYGMRFIGLWRKRKILSSQEMPNESLGNWLEERIRRRAVTRERKAFFRVVNEQIEWIRKAGKIAREAGMKSWIEKDVKKSLERWDIIAGCPACTDQANKQLNELAEHSTAMLASMSEIKRAQLEASLVDWLYVLVRHNIKRGRFWELSDLLTQHQADCLGYARILTFLANSFGLESGVVEVVQDNRGKYVPHCVCLVKLADGQKRLIDSWYGSANICHQIVVARIKVIDSLVTKQLPMTMVRSTREVYGLRMEQVAGLSFYILGNSYLKRDMETEAVECYNVSLWLYPENPRTLFNRAIASERIQATKQAQTDYQRAFSIDSSLAKILATTEDIEPLIELDEKRVSESDQQVYLLRKGFITGSEEGWSEIARRCERSPVEVEVRFNSVVNKISSEATK